jgi:hypothetical protein
VGHVWVTEALGAVVYELKVLVRGRVPDAGICTDNAEVGGSIPPSPTSPDQDFYGEAAGRIGPCTTLHHRVVAPGRGLVSLRSELSRNLTSGPMVKTAAIFVQKATQQDFKSGAIFRS